MSLLCFFFKQKTAYELRSSDWSSDVCSSDLIGRIDFERFFAKEMAGLKAEGRYRIFADLERRAGDFPHAMRHGPGGAEAVTVWCSNDYTGTGQHPQVLPDIHARTARCGSRSGSTPTHFGPNPHPSLLHGQCAPNRDT